MPVGKLVNQSRKEATADYRVILETAVLILLMLERNFQLPQDLYHHFHWVVVDC